MADLVKIDRTSTAGQGVTRTDGSQGQKGSYTETDQGWDSSTQTNPLLVVDGESSPGEATTNSTENSPERTTTETRDATVNRKVAEANIVTQTQGEQRSARVVREDAGIQVTFTMRITGYR
jgi:hypothetical protein